MSAFLNLRTMSNAELERMYYQAGMPEIAAIYAQAADVQAESDEYQEQIGKMVDAKRLSRSRLLELLTAIKLDSETMP